MPGQDKPALQSATLQKVVHSAQKSAHDFRELLESVEEETRRLRKIVEANAKKTSQELRRQLQQHPISLPSSLGDLPVVSPLLRRGGKRRGTGRGKRAAPEEAGEREGPLAEEHWTVRKALRSAWPQRPFGPMLREQARTLPGAKELLAAPQRFTDISKQTTSNLQDNLQTLGQHLQRNGDAEYAAVPAPDLSRLEREQRRQRVAFTTTARLVAVPVAPGAAQTEAEKDRNPVADIFQNLEDTVGVRTTELLRDVYTNFLKPREDAQGGGLDPLPPRDLGSPRPSQDRRPFGPLQREAQRRRREARRRRQSSLREPGRRVAIYTTASLPWMTGTAVNPLLRAAYLSREAHRQVTLVIPWLAAPDQARLFPPGVTFASPAEQGEYVLQWARQRTGLPCNFKVAFYPGRYASEKCSILPVGDPTSYIPDSEADVAVLEEPEHLNWYHHGRRWTDKFPHVVGIIHTNYLDYAMREDSGKVKAQALSVVNQLCCRWHCHKVVKLSDAVQPLPRQTTQFVHGVPDSFLRVGQQRAAAPEPGQARFTKGAYFIGKAVWAKGYTELLQLLDEQGRGLRAPVDCFGYGEDLPEMKAISRKRKLPVVFHGAKDHLNEDIHEYQVFLNPSTSDVVATTTAEALAMGKWVVVADLPCNAFFQGFPNCLTYRTPEEFRAQLDRALASEPAPMSPQDRRRLTWEDATERFLDVAELSAAERPSVLDDAADRITYAAFNALTGVETLRALSGAGAGTRDNPPSLLSFEPQSDMGGLFDRRPAAAPL